ncbi:MAG: GAF domain-containing SpoIIE family protein phosphatase [Candidatus Acidiferrales bacterium]|jgi:phosphoserine phosphatase RsbU/P
MIKRKPAKKPAPAKKPLPLDHALAKLNTETDPGEVAAQIVSLLAPGVVAGARMWRIANNALVVWRESGELPEAERGKIEKVLQGKSGSANGNHIWMLGRGDVPVGILELHPAGKLPAKNSEWLELFRRYAEIALESSERRNALIEMSTIVEATKRLNSTLDLAELLNIILQLTTRHTGAERGTVFLVDRDAGEIWSLVGLGLDQHEIRLPITKGIAGWVATHGETVNLEDAYNDPRFEPEVDLRLGFRTKSLLCLPIRSKNDEVIGVLQLLNKKNGAFTRANENLLSAISDHVALALENAQLHRDLLHKQRMERDLALARSIQVGLLPDRPPKLEGFEVGVSHRPSLEVGGDYYDFIPLTADTMLIVVADVEGKGVGSAMVMANLQATLHALLAHVHALERLVESLSDMMLADTRGQKFMTMFIGLLDRTHRSLHYVNAGHVQPAVIRATGGVDYLTEGGMVVGLFPGVRYERGHVKLHPGDIVVACTDGITEADNVKEEEYGSGRLIELVARERKHSAEEIVQSVLTEVDEFSRGGQHEDDRVIMILKVT